MDIGSMRPVDVKRESASKPRRAPLVLAVAGMAIGWFFVVWAHLNLPQLLLRLSLLAYAVIALAWVVALVPTVITTVLAARRMNRRYLLSGMAGFLALACITVITVDWPPASVRAAFDADDFDAVAARARAGEFGSALSTEYYGANLPPELDHVSANGKVAVIGSNNGRPVLFVPAVLGFPDDAVGWAHIVGAPQPNLALDGFGDPGIHPRANLGHGWWWVE